jgi:TolB-like protein/class 3 adenylate cyclase/Tfp pilus assembly protein PilF
MTSSMSSASPSELKFEIGHVLFIDIVGYSKLLINQQSEQLETLRAIVRGTEQVRLAEAEGKLLRLPTGDGGALVFRNSPEAPVLCALEVAKELKRHPELKVRMGIHSGPVNEVVDLNEQTNIAGAGINVAQRVMDCGDAGHILLSKHVADDLEQYPRWQSCLHDLGECEVKHGVRVDVFNFHDDKIGNQQLPKRLQVLQKHRARLRWTAVGVALLLLLGVATAFVIVSKKSATSIPTVPEKSIAVLPFENLSDDKSNAYFAEGVQDEILTRLAKVADLKVISRTSTQKYGSAPDNLREIARQLGVAHILEGSVQRENDQMRVDVQLINALTDTHLWADIYDRKVADLFATESEIAKTIADTLQAKLTGSEAAAIAKAPTADHEAYELYLRGRFFWNKRTAADLRRSIELFEDAIKKDPNFAAAYAGAAQSWLLLPAYDGGAPQDCFPKAKLAAEKALSLDSTCSDGHTALGAVRSNYEFDLTGAIAEFEQAIKLNPNDATAHHWFGHHPLTCLGQSERALAELRRAQELDPLSLIINANIGYTYIVAGRLEDAIAQLRRAIELDGNFYYAIYVLGEAFELKDSFPEAISQYQKAIALTTDPIPRALLGRLYGSHGRPDEARQIFQQLKQEREQRFIPAYCLALICLGLNERNEALNWLEESYRERDGFDILFIRVDPFLKPLRGDARFEALAEKIVPARVFGANSKLRR